MWDGLTNHESAFLSGRESELCGLELRVQRYIEGRNWRYNRAASATRPWQANPRRWRGGIAFRNDGMVNLREGFDHSRPDFPVGTPFWESPSFRALIDACPDLGAMEKHLPTDLRTMVFEGQAEIEAVPSSYKDHGYGYLFYVLVRLLKPARCVEFGVLHGFSLMSIAAALRDNEHGSIQGFDLFEEYPYHHATYASVLRRIEACGLQRWAGIYPTDVWRIHQQLDLVDVLHVDISNDGNTYRRIFSHWAQKVRQVILFEGGSAKRDRVDWMVKYGKDPIAPEIDEFRRSNPDWIVVVLEPYPSLTVAIRRGGLAGREVL